MARKQSTSNQEGMGSGKVLAIGAGVVAAAGAAALGYYFYASTNAKENRKKAAAWANNLKRDAMAEIRRLESFDRGAILRAIDTVAGLYDTVRGVDKQEVGNVIQELKNNWERLKEEAFTSASEAKGTVKRTARRAKKKAA